MVEIRDTVALGGGKLTKTDDLGVNSLRRIVSRISNKPTTEPMTEGSSEPKKETR